MEVRPTVTQRPAAWGEPRRRCVGSPNESTELGISSISKTSYSSLKLVLASWETRFCVEGYSDTPVEREAELRGYRPPAAAISSATCLFGLARALRWFAGDYHKVVPFT
jgi:hypothetical protein